MKKKFLIIMLSALITVIMPTIANATDKTRDEALAWAQSQVGKALDYDGAYGAQCVDLIKYYYAYLGVTPAHGNGCDYATNPLPDGWQRLQGAAPEPGDILVYSGSSSNPAGHVAIYESDYSHYNQNVSGKQWVVKCTWHYAAYEPYWGVIRPNFSGGGSGGDTSNTYKAYVSGTDGSLYINSIPKKGNGIGEIPEGAVVTVDANRTSGNWLWVTYNGVSGYSYNKYLIKTNDNASSGSITVTTTNVTNITETNAKVNGQVSYSGPRPSEVGIYFGISPDNMSKVARDSINHNKNPFDMWYDLNGEAGQYLSPGTTYYWQCYAIVNGSETKGEVKSFSSAGPPPTPVPTPTPTPTSTPEPTPEPIPTPKPAKTPDPEPVRTVKPTKTPSNENYYNEYQTSVLTVFVGDNMQIAVDDILVRFIDAKPFVDSNDRTQVPIRAVSEMLDCDVDWIPETHTAIITKENGDSIVIVIGSNTMIVNGGKVKMDTAALIKNDRAYIPVRFVAEALGLTVEWE